ncbi:MAG TPA: hypothetical protein VMT54_00850 [Candidatus Cybelea sp.]|nr:hypothetical protein [Candidatus Cybelea sp.]
MRKSRPGAAFLARERRLWRRCLACLAMFDSAWVGERICRRCKCKPGWREGSADT